MSKEQNKKYDGQNRCRRCNRPLSDPNDIYGWWCAQIVGFDKYREIVVTLDDDALKGYTAYVTKYLGDDGNNRSENFTVKRRKYTNTFIREKTEDPKKVKYTVISDINIWGEDFQVEYTIDDGGVSFKFEDNTNYPSILWRGGGEILAKAIYDAGKLLSPDNLFGRTVEGINTELQIHWAAYKIGLLKGNASPANVGGMKAPGKDENAWVFEAIQLTEDIINPKADDVIDLVKGIWRYLQK